MNDAQEMANEYMMFLNHKTEKGHTTMFYDSLSSNYDTSQKINNVNKILKAIEFYTRICINIDKHLAKLYNENDDVIHTEESLLKQKEFYVGELKLLENAVSFMEFDDIFKEIEFIERGHNLRELSSEYT